MADPKAVVNMRHCQSINIDCKQNRFLKNKLQLFNTPPTAREIDLPITLVCLCGDLKKLKSLTDCMNGKIVILRFNSLI